MFNPVRDFGFIPLEPQITENHFDLLKNVDLFCAGEYSFSHAVEWQFPVCLLGPFNLVVFLSLLFSSLVLWLDVLFVVLSGMQWFDCVPKVHVIVI